MERAERFIQRQFGADARWTKVNRVIWGFFMAHQGERLGLTAISEMAASRSLTVDEFMSILGLLTGPDNEFIRRIYYRRTPTGEEIRVPATEVAGQTRRWVYEREADESQWRDWASKVMVGWSPVEKLSVSYSTH
jgi:hypothetical protein